MENYQTVRVELEERSYDILLGQGLLNQAGRHVIPLVQSNKVIVVHDENVTSPHGQTLIANLENAGLEVATLELQAGEQTKCLQQLERIWDYLSELRFGRDCTILPLGGGVTGDLVGFAAATYLRGVEMIQVPTSLLAMVDSSVGGKTGINNKFGKNLIGSFWQPKMVIIDIDTLKTLPREERVAAVAEIIKYGVIYDAAFFQWLEKNIQAVCDLDPKAITYAVKRSCEIKADVVSKDEREGGLRMILNFGHTIGHAIENTAGYGTIRHGEGVAIGMIAESLLALDRNPEWKAPHHDRLVNLTRAAGLPTKIPDNLELTKEQLFDAARSDKKNRGGGTRYILPIRLGRVEVVKLEDKDVEETLIAIGAK
jgi:3-dehydroquinate synthase